MLQCQGNYGKRGIGSWSFHLTCVTFRQGGEKRKVKASVINISVGDPEDLLLSLMVMDVASGF